MAVSESDHAMYLDHTTPEIISAFCTVPYLLTLMAIGIIFLALSYWFRLIAIPRMVYKNNVGAAFEIKEIYKEIQLLGWKKYLICGLFLVVISILSMGAGMFLPGILSKYGTVGYLIVLIIIPLIFDSFFYNFQGRFMGLIYPGEVENEDYDSSDEFRENLVSLRKNEYLCP